jgi:hypothetical protein
MNSRLEEHRDMTGSMPRAHHFLPRFYLRGFCDPDSKIEGRIWIYEKNRPPRPSRVEKAAVQRDLYSFVEKDSGELDARFEMWLAQRENLAAPIFPRLDDFAFVLTEAERINLLWFVALLFHRVPDAFRVGREIVDPALTQLIMEAARDPDAFRELFSRVFSPEELVEVEAERRELVNGRTDLICSEWTPLAAMHESAKQTVSILERLDLQFVHADDSEDFLTTDSPVVTFHILESGESQVGCGFATEGMEVVVPLTRRVLLRIGPHGLEGSHATLVGTGVRIANKMLMSCAAKRAYASGGSERLKRAFDRHGCLHERGRDIHIPMWKGEVLRAK